MSEPSFSRPLRRLKPRLIAGVVAALAAATLGVPTAQAATSPCEATLGPAYELAMSTDLGAKNLFKTGSAPNYTVDNRAAFAGRTIGRVAYCLELNSTWVVAEFAAQSGDPNLVGVPFEAGAKINRTLPVSVFSNVSTLKTGWGLQGTVEFWPGGYSASTSKSATSGSSTNYDHDDSPSTSGTTGSMQVHVSGLGQSAQTVFAFNSWNGYTGNSDLGIGNGASTRLDWTSAHNAANYSTKRLSAYVVPVVGTMTTNGLTDGALLARAGDDRSAIYQLSGVAPAGATSVVASALAGADPGSLVPVTATPGTVDGATGAYSVDLEVPVGLTAHVVRVEAEGPGGRSLVYQANNVVGGDAFVIQGQSNAVAGMWRDSTLAKSLRSPWIRTFGSTSTVASNVTTATANRWTMADTDTASTVTAVGRWGMKMGNDLVAQGVPVAILNGGVGGKSSTYFVPTADHLDLNTNYGRLNYRLTASGLKSQPARWFYYQGETEGKTPNESAYAANVQSIFNAWRQDAPALQRIYLVQIHQGCTDWSSYSGVLGLQEMQRQISVARSDTTLVTALALPGHDGCHFSWDGYRALGSQFAALILRDQGATTTAGVEAPQPVAAQFADATNRTVVVSLLNPTDTPATGTPADFVLTGSSATAVSVVASSGALRVTFNQPVTAGASLTYKGITSPFTTSAIGWGLAAFRNLPISAAP